MIDECLHENKPLPEIKVLNSDLDNLHHTSAYKDIIHKILYNIVPTGFFDQRDFEGELPLLKSLVSAKTPGHLIFYVFGKYQKHSLKFFIEMLSNWLAPGRRLPVAMIFSSQFYIPSAGATMYTVCKMIINVDTPTDLDQIKANLPIIESEIRLGMESSYYAKRILEVKGLSTDAKTAVIQENIAYLIERKPQYFDFDTLTEMQHVLVMCRDEFKSQRKSRHLSRIIGIQYLFRKSLSNRAPGQSKRRLLLKVFRSEIQFRNQNKHVLGIIVGFNFLRDKEVFEKRHLMRAIQNQIPNALLIENSFLDSRRAPENLCTLYLEIEKSNDEKFTNQEITRLRQSLPADLMDSIEQIVHPVFMPRNEEEVMRNIFSLSLEVKYLRDLPQVIINFDEQTYSKLIFTIIVVRVSMPGKDSIKDLFEKSNSILDYVHERCKSLGVLRSKYIKEATVFRVKINKDEFIRRDHSIDLNKARQIIVFELLRIIGEFRDFNGGIISKENELLAQAKSLIEDEIKFNELVLENFFFSMMPTVVRTLLEPEVLKKFFVLFCETLDILLDPSLNYAIRVLSTSNYAYVVVKSELRLNRDEVLRDLSELRPKSSDIASTYVFVQEVNYNGFIFRCADLERQEQFFTIIKNSVSQMLTP